MRPAATLAILSLAALSLAACSHPKGPCAPDSAHDNPYARAVQEASAPLARLRAATGGLAIDQEEEAALATLACKGTTFEYFRRVHDLTVPFWWAYWASTCDAGGPPVVTGVPAKTARVAFRARCPGDGIDPFEK